MRLPISLALLVCLGVGGSPTSSPTPTLAIPALPCVTLGEDTLDFEITERADEVYSVQARAIVSADTEATTMYVVGEPASTRAITLRFRAGGHAKIIDGAGTSMLVEPDPSGGATKLVVATPEGSTFTILPLDGGTALGPKQGKGKAKGKPPTAKRAVIKPVTKCPA